MSKKTAVAAVFAALACVGAFLAGARKAQAQPSAVARLELIAEDRDTSVYAFKHEGHACYVATTRGGAGITMQCAK